jgi:hypothetical protein
VNKIILGLLLSLSCGAASAQFIKGTQLREWLSADERVENGLQNHVDYTNSASGLGYITGIAETFNVLGLLCIPDGVTRGQMQAIVSKYLKEHPEKWNSDANPIVYVALSSAFPCKK